MDYKELEIGKWYIIGKGNTKTTERPYKYTGFDSFKDYFRFIRNENGNEFIKTIPYECIKDFIFKSYENVTFLRNSTEVYFELGDKYNFHTYEYTLYKIFYDFHTQQYKLYFISRNENSLVYEETQLKRLLNSFPNNYKKICNENKFELKILDKHKKEFKIQEETKMKLEELNKKNLKEAKKQFEIERNTKEVEFAIKEIHRLWDLKEDKERIIRIAKEELKNINKQLKMYD